ncbi:OmpA family protein [Bradyrhizobium diazoefficiens]|jgi:outer membrane protein OmpA-like peptidoglycan-associated protein|nr:OmpA family protein [Bradyrhizobium diazoefficiens]UCF51361.1 MAG: OmpA family protein [Bradyrhizobium sp.]MBR0978101.1 OmpA family protein [Bradyrhizobium diazoefficiens]MBR1006032.1 OmpA family protein [Bradyrhizobium diazoefficiens]MBR1014084.1 OmpA family protein [Bradyrhizobium diazoefficiens]
MQMPQCFLRLVLCVTCGALPGVALAQTAAPAPTPPAAAAAPPPPTPIPFDDALLKAANDLFSKANLNGAPDKVTVVIDPLIDGVTGAQSKATHLEEKRIADLVKSSYPRFQVARFSAETLAKGPVVLIGTFTAVNNAGVAGGAKDAYRICLALADMKTKTIISKGVARALPEGIDPTPAAFFNDSPVFARDSSTDSYVKTCQGTKVGDNVDQAYADRIVVASLVNDGIEAYDAGRYRDALDAYQSALKTPGGEQLRVLNGIYLANTRLRRTRAAMDAFGKVVDYGLASDKLAVKFLFKPGSTLFVNDRSLRAPYDSWLQKIAERTAAKQGCLEVVGHTSATGLPAVNDRLSALRADYIKDRLEDDQTTLHGRLIATGRGSREMIVGTGRDDASDALDRRVEFKVSPCGGAPGGRST